MTYTEENPKTGWLLIGLFVLFAMMTYSLKHPEKTWEGESGYEGPVFFYKNVANMTILKAICQLEGGMYLSTIQNIFMIIAVKILHLKTNIFVAIESMNVLYLVMCLAPFCSHYFRKYFSRTFRFICSSIVVCFAPISTEYNVIGYVGVFYLILLLIYDFEEINNLIYAFILLMIPVVCMSKMMFVVFAPLMVIYYFLFGKEMNRKKKWCIAAIGIFSFMEGALSILLRHGVQSGHTLGTIQHVTFSTLINKILYYTVQTFGIQLRCGISNANQLLENVNMSVLVIGILTFTIWQIIRKRKYRREAKFILVMFCLIIFQCSVILLTTTAWYADISWRQSMSSLPGFGVYFSNVAELNEKVVIVFYAHKTVATNQILDRYYYANIFDKNGNLISRIRQINPDAERLYIGFYPEEGVPDIGRVEFTHEDGSPAFVDDTIEIGYR